MAMNANDGKENSERADQRARHTTLQIADKRGRREDRSRRDQRDRDGIQKLLVREPVQAVHKIGAKECHQGVAATVKRRRRFS